jgi:hypothetical protein
MLLTAVLEPSCCSRCRRACRRPLRCRPSVEAGQDENAVWMLEGLTGGVLGVGWGDAVDVWITL